MILRYLYEVYNSASLLFRARNSTKISSDLFKLWYLAVDQIALHSLAPA